MKINKGTLRVASYILIVGGLAATGLIFYGKAQYTKAQCDSSSYIRKLAQSEVDKAIQIEQKKIMTLNVTQALGEGDVKEGVDILNNILTTALNKFFADSIGIESIWRAFAKQKEMLRLTLSEIYYDSQAH